MRRILTSSLVAIGLGCGSALAAPQALPTVSAGPWNPQTLDGATFRTPFKGFGGYRKGPDGQFHGYGVFSESFRRKEAAEQDRFGSEERASRKQSVAGDVLAATIAANIYAPYYRVGRFHFAY